VHVDGAFGLWAAGISRVCSASEGANDADSWAIDCHKWSMCRTNSGIAVVREPEHLRRAMLLSAAYLQTSSVREPCHLTPEARGGHEGLNCGRPCDPGPGGLRGLVERNLPSWRNALLEGLQRAGSGVERGCSSTSARFVGDTDETQRVISEVTERRNLPGAEDAWRGALRCESAFRVGETRKKTVDGSLAAILRIATRSRTRRTGARHSRKRQSESGSLFDDMARHPTC